MVNREQLQAYAERLVKVSEVGSGRQIVGALIDTALRENKSLEGVKQSLVKRRQEIAGNRKRQALYGTAIDDAIHYIEHGAEPLTNGNIINLR